jgi:hypothetical protein
MLQDHADFLIPNLDLRGIIKHIVPMASEGPTGASVGN